MRKLSHNDISAAAVLLHQKIVQRMGNRTYRIWGIPRGGVSAALALQAVSSNKLHPVDNALDADIIVDDLADSGKTRMAHHERARRPVGVLFTKDPSRDAKEGWDLWGAPLDRQEWVVFPWEGGETGSADDIVVRLLQYLGEDPERQGLTETPARVLKAWKHWCSGYTLKPEDVLKSFKDGAEGVDEMVLVKNIPIYSHCEHHLAPFFGVAHIAYIPNGHIAGLSKLVRLAEVFARRLQVQERITNQIADALTEHLSARGAGVVLECRHLCMESRGVCKSGATTVTSAMRGAMLDKPAARAELLSLVRDR